jgi:hypothetical protein
MMDALLIAAALTQAELGGDMQLDRRRSRQ